MNYHKLLSKQVAKFLPEEMQSSPAMQDFLSVVSASYKAQERDIELAERAHQISEEEYIEINQKLEDELKVKKLSIAKLKEVLGNISGEEKHIDSDDLLIIARYINKQVSKRKNAEKVFTSLIANMQSGILLEDESGHIVFANQLFCDLFKIQTSPESLQGADCSVNVQQCKDLFKYPLQFVENIEKILSQKKLVTDQILETADDRIYQRNYIPIFSENVFKGQLWSYTDITEAKKAQNTIEQSELKNRLIMKSALDAIITIDFEGFITNWNPRAESIFGWKEAEVIGAKFSEIILPVQQGKNHERRIEKYIKTGNADELSKQMELIAINRAGDEFPVEFSIIAVQQAHATFFCSFIRDISENKKNRLELERLSLVASANENGVLFTNREGNIFWCNEGLKKITGYEDEDIIGKTPVELFRGPLTNKESLKKMVDEFSSGKSFYTEMVFYRKDGSWFWGRTKGQAIKNKDGSIHYFAIVEDISEVEAVQRKLKEYEGQLKLALTNVGDNYWEHNFKTDKTYFSNPDNTLLGYSFDEVSDAAALWWSRVHPDDKKLLSENDELYKKGLKDHHINEYRVINKNGSIHWVLDKGVVVEKDDDDKPLKIIGAHIDITKQKELELELIKAKEVAEASTKAKEMFLANMSHEIRTPMNAIMGMSNQLGKSSLNAEQQFYLNTINSAADNLLIIINDILDLSKIEAGKLTVENIGFEPKAVIERVMQVMVHKAEEKGLSMTNEICDATLSPVLIGDPYRINQILLNLISNSIKFTEKGTVDVSYKVIEDNAVSQTVCITVKDTGIGMDKSFAKNLFQKFTQEDESVTRRFGGTGLGMSICKQLIELLNGTIVVTSEKGSGTTVTFSLPFKKGSYAHLPKKDTGKLPADILSGKKVLVTDDNEMNRLVATTILKNYGALVEEAQNGAEAVDKLNTQSFDIVLMDVQMPVMDGLEATKLIREKFNSKLPIIALTALALKGDEAKFLEAGMNDYLSKPFQENQLVNMVSRWLNSSVKAKEVLA